MLSDHERDVLDAMKLQLATDDPRFIQEFDFEAHRVTAAGAAHRRAIATRVLVVALVLTVLMIAVHAVGPTLVFTGVSCWAIWQRGWPRAADRTRDS